MVGEKRVRRMQSCADDSKNKVAFTNHYHTECKDKKNFLKNLRYSTEQKTTTASSLSEKTTGYLENYIKFYFKKRA